jgi:hypothetical protein
MTTIGQYLWKILLNLKKAIDLKQLGRLHPLYPNWHKAHFRLRLWKIYRWAGDVIGNAS